MEILRVEDEEGFGPYSSGFGYRYGNSDFRLCPEPNEDELLKNSWRKLYDSEKYRDYYFGFLDLQQLLIWFPIENIKSDDSHHEKTFLNTYKINKRYVRIGKSQIIFKLNEATLIKRKNIGNFLKEYQ